MNKYFDNLFFYDLNLKRTSDFNVDALLYAVYEKDKRVKQVGLVSYSLKYNFSQSKIINEVLTLRFFDVVCRIVGLNKNEIDFQIGSQKKKRVVIKKIPIFPLSLISNSREYTLNPKIVLKEKLDIKPLHITTSTWIGEDCLFSSSSDFDVFYNKRTKLIFDTFNKDSVAKYSLENFVLAFSFFLRKGLYEFPDPGA